MILVTDLLCGHVDNRSLMRGGLDIEMKWDSTKRVVVEAGRQQEVETEKRRAC